MKKNGFTLVELTMTIVIILIISLIVTPKITKIISDGRNRGYLEIKSRLKEAAMKYLNDQYVDTTSGSIVVTKSQLVENKYIDEIHDLKDNSVCDATITITNLDANPVYNVSLSCANFSG